MSDKTKVFFRASQAMYDHITARGGAGIVARRDLERYHELLGAAECIEMDDLATDIARILGDQTYPGTVEYRFNYLPKSLRARLDTLDRVQFLRVLTDVEALMKKGLPE